MKTYLILFGLVAFVAAKVAREELLDEDTNKVEDDSSNKVTPGNVPDSEEIQIKCTELFDKEKVCSTSNVTWDSECELAVAHNQCGEQEKECRSKHRIGYFGECTLAPITGLVLGVYSGNETSDPYLTPTAAQVIQPFKEEFEKQFKLVCHSLKKGSARILYGISDEYPAIAIVGLGKENEGYDDNEDLDMDKENVRKAVAAGCRGLEKIGCVKVTVDSCGDPEVAAEAAHLSTFRFQPLKTTKKRPLYLEILVHGDKTSKGFLKRGLLMAEGQKLARYLSDMPANYMTPTIFADKTKKFFEGMEVDVEVYDETWAKEKGMGSFLSVAQGSREPAKFVELTYNGGIPGDAPVVLVGKGITFDAGGTNIKLKSIERMRADMTGAGIVVSAIRTLALLKAPINLKGLVPMTENMPGGAATKTNDVVVAMNGQTIQVVNTDAEGRLVLADALLYAETFRPAMIMDIATLTGGTKSMLGSSAAGAFTPRRKLWEDLKKAASRTGDRLWRLPLWKDYSDYITDCHLGDVCLRAETYKYAGTPVAASFLRQFVKTDNWIHIDMANVNVGESNDPPAFVKGGMTGRPFRTIVEYLQSLVIDTTKIY